MNLLSLSLECLTSLIKSLPQGSDLFIPLVPTLSALLLAWGPGLSSVQFLWDEAKGVAPSFPYLVAVTVLAAGLILLIS